MFIENYNKNRECLTKLEFKIINEIINEQNINLTTSIHKLATNHNASVATINRLVHKLGYRGFIEFKVDVTDYFNKEINVLKELSIDILGDTKATLEMLDQIDIQKICDLIKNANKIMIIGYGINHYLARIMEVKLKVMGIDAIHNTNAYYSRLELKNKNRPDLIIALSKTGKTEEVVSVLKDAYQLQIPTLLIAEQTTENHNLYVQHLIETTPSIEDDLYLNTRLQAHVVIEYILKNLQKRILK